MEVTPDFALLSLGMRRMGWLRFWSQTILSVVIVGVLIFNQVGRGLKESENALGLSAGVSFTTLSFFFLLYSLWQGWLIVRNGRALKSSVRPTRGETSRLLKRGIIIDLLGILIALIGYQLLGGALFVQASQLGPALVSAEYNPITSLEIFLVLGNTQVLFAHFIGLILSLWLLQRIYRHK